MIYEFECSSIKCLQANNDKPYEFEMNIPLKDADKTPTCPRCISSLDVKRIIKYVVPKSKSWNV